jgi:hypothetical protein
MQALWGGLDAFDKASDEVMTVGKVDVAALDAAGGCRAGFSSVGVGGMLWMALRPRYRDRNRDRDRAWFIPYKLSIPMPIPIPMPTRAARGCRAGFSSVGGVGDVGVCRPAGAGCSMCAASHG